MNIGHVIKILRIHRRMTQEQVALEADMATSNVSRIEKGQRQPSQKVLQKLAIALNTKPSILYAASEHSPEEIVDFLQQEDDKEKHAGNPIDIHFTYEAKMVLSLFNELTPNNKSLLLEQLKAIHKWQTKTDH
jgi:transcriptional regulator with XRE-family HTH domain